VQPLLLGLARCAVRVYYRVQHLGESVPASGPLLLVGNHPNGLVDPVLVAGTTARPVRFLGKAPLFEMPVLGRVMRGLQALPVYRGQDGADTGANVGTFAAVHAALARGEVVCLFPEGRSHDEPALVRLKTGAARMALGAEAEAGWSLGVRIVPVGLVYRAKPSFRSRVAVWTGAPLAVLDLRARHASDERGTVEELTRRIAAALGNVTLALERWEDLPLLELAERILYSEREGRLQRLQAFARGLRALRARSPEVVQDLEARLAAFRLRLERLGMEPHELPDRLRLPYRPAAVARFVLRNLIVLLAGLPLALVGALLWFLPHRFVGWLPKRFASPDVLATARILSACAFFPLWLALLVALAWAGIDGRWAAAMALAAGPLGLLALAFRDWRRATLAEVRTFLLLASRARLRARLEGERLLFAREIALLAERIAPGAAGELDPTPGSPG
jgi:1-acyl-sn-glycerol-3-phosphate acyltransferase